MTGRTSGHPISPDEPRVQAIAAASLVVVVMAVAIPLILIRWAGTSEAEVSESDIIGLNRLGAATVDIEVGRVTTMLGTVDLAPGDTTVGSVEVGNAGSLPLRYRLTVRGSGGRLGAWLHWITWVRTSPCTQDGAARVRAAIDDPGFSGPEPGAEISIGPRVLDPGNEDVLCVAAHLPLSAPNGVQGTELSVELLADAEHAIDNEDEPAGG